MFKTTGERRMGEVTRTSTLIAVGRLLKGPSGSPLTVRKTATPNWRAPPSPIHVAVAIPYC